eukprot:SAG31_NODE_2749_length_5147_cov_1.972662_5_plen_60_part_00
MFFFIFLKKTMYATVRYGVLVCACVRALPDRRAAGRRGGAAGPGSDGLGRVVSTIMPLP